MGRPDGTTSSGGWLAMLFGVATEGAAIWLFDLLPRWAQIALLAPPIALFLVGMGLVVRDRLRRGAVARRARTRGSTA